MTKEDDRSQERYRDQAAGQSRSESEDESQSETAAESLAGDKAGLGSVGDAEPVSDVEQPDGQSNSDPKVEDLYKSDVDRRLWAPAVDLEEEAKMQRKRLRRWIMAVRSAFRRWLSIR
jgi:hypothetical protein